MIMAEPLTAREVAVKKATTGNPTEGLKAVVGNAEESKAIAVIL